MASRSVKSATVSLFRPPGAYHCATLSHQEHGADFSHQTFLDRQRKMKEKVPNSHSQPAQQREFVHQPNEHAHSVVVVVLGSGSSSRSAPRSTLITRISFSASSRVFALVSRRLQNLGPKTPKAVGHLLEVSPEQTQAQVSKQDRFCSGIYLRIS